MITYEEFLKEKNIKDFSSLQIRTCEEEKEISYLDVSIVGNLKDYIEVIRNAERLRSVYISEIGDINYYGACRELMKNANNNVRVMSNVIGKASKKEFFEAEKIIDEVVREINLEWTVKQKLAYVHYKMGELVSYYPDFNFVGLYKENAEDTRSIWKSIVKGRSVCNGVVMITRNILSRVGVKTQELSSGYHSFLLTQTDEGNIITDPTWDLSKTLFQARPIYFGKTYKQLREIDGPFGESHKLEEEPENVIEITEEELRDVYHSIGLTDDERKFKMPILEKLNSINGQQFQSVKDKVDAFFNMFTKDFQKEASHLSETRSMLESCLCELGIDIDKVKTRFVYSKDDEDYKKPILALHINVDGCEEIVKMLDLESMQFIEIELEELYKQYRQHEDNKLPILGEGIRSDSTRTKENQQNSEQQQ